MYFPPNHAWNFLLTFHEGVLPWLLAWLHEVPGRGWLWRGWAGTLGRGQRSSCRREMVSRVEAARRRHYFYWSQKQAKIASSSHDYIHQLSLSFQAKCFDFGYFTSPLPFSTCWRLLAYKAPPCLKVKFNSHWQWGLEKRSMSCMPGWVGKILRTAEHVFDHARCRQIHAG